MKKFSLITLIILIIACIYTIFIWQPGSEKASLAQPQGGDFHLTTNTGPINLDDFKGKVLLIYFGYTMCPDICPTNLSMMANALSQLSDKELSQVQGIFISVDPQRDTMTRLSEYTNYFHPSLIGLSSTPEVIRELADRYGAAYQKVVQEDSATNYVVDHSSETYVINPQGKLVDRLSHAAPPAEIIAAIRKYAE